MSTSSTEKMSVPDYGRFAIGFDQRDRARLHALIDEVLDSNRWSEGGLTARFEAAWREWNGLGAVKHEFMKFGSVIDKVSRKLDETQKVIDDEVGRRRRAMERSLRAVEVLPEAEATALLAFDSRDALVVDDELEAPLAAAE